MNHITLSGLHKHYKSSGRDVHAVRGVDLTVDAGSVLALVGPSGCGKTSILRMLAGIEHPTAGVITMAGETVFDQSRGIDLPPDRRNIGMVFQSYALWPHMSVFENVAYPFRRRKKTANLHKEVMQLLDAVGVSQLSDRYPGELSGGQQQRVAFARALGANPRVILFDEPLSNLDFKLRERLKFDLKSLQREIGFTAVYVTHDRDEALTLGDRLAVLSDGVVQQVGAPDELYSKPKNEFVFNFLGNTGHLNGTVKESGAEWTVVQAGENIVKARTIDQVTVGSIARIGFHIDGLELMGRSSLNEAAALSGNIVHCRVLESFYAGSRKYVNIEMTSGSTTRIAVPTDMDVVPESAIQILPDNCYAFAGGHHEPE